MPSCEAGHMDAVDHPSEVLAEALEPEGPFSNRSSSVNRFCCCYLAGVTVLSAVDIAAATSGPKHRRCNVHNGLTRKTCGPTASLAACLHPRPGGQLAPALLPRAVGSHQGLLR